MTALCPRPGPIRSKQNVPWIGMLVTSSAMTAPGESATAFSAGTSTGLGPSVIAAADATADQTHMTVRYEPVQADGGLGSLQPRAGGTDHAATAAAALRGQWRAGSPPWLFLALTKCIVRLGGCRSGEQRQQQPRCQIPGCWHSCPPAERSLVGQGD